MADDCLHLWRGYVIHTGMSHLDERSSSSAVGIDMCLTLKISGRSGIYHVKQYL
jgi:hypothetical protein